MSRRGLALLAVLVVAAGCGTPAYLVRAGWEEARILLRRQPITALLARSDLEPALRQRLELTLAVRRFAGDTLGLHVGDSYTSFAEVDGESPVWVVSAAHRDRLEAYKWRYPLVGKLPYRGFFDRGDAEDLARDLAARDLDVEVRPAMAFSTLGWFADPLLSTAAEEPPVVIAETVIHELFHQTLYLPGAAAFNESAATFAGHRGAIAFFCGAAPAAGVADPRGACMTARARWDRTRAHGQVLERLADRLRRLYAAAPPVGVRERMRSNLARSAADSLARRRLPGGDDLVPPNNARLLSALAYATELDTFDSLASGDADLGPALGALVGAARDAKEPFDVLDALASRK